MFSESDNDEPTSSKAPTTAAAKTVQKQKNETKNLTLFDDGDESEHEDYGQGFAVKEQFQGAKGAKLMKLQSRFQNDSRFKMDARFLDDYGRYQNEGDGGEEEEEGDNTEMNNVHYNGDEAPEEDERQWQYNILNSVMGKRVNQGPPAPSKDSKKK